MSWPPVVSPTPAHGSLLSMSPFLSQPLSKIDRDLVSFSIVRSWSIGGHIMLPTPSCL
ncbi:hypothetical protein CGRA01v4_05996 [Colletotrichum graminicola]|nr:hypothetical protein CGRA01v4_05996 [Colletotrichum graminicola]